MKDDTLFDLGPAPDRGDPLRTTPTSPTAPAAPRARRAGRAHIAPEQPTVRRCVARVLREAGEHGATIQQIAEQVGRLRGKTTKETTITQPLKDLREAEQVRDSGRTRPGNAGVAITVWVWIGESEVQR